MCLGSGEVLGWMGGRFVTVCAYVLTRTFKDLGRCTSSESDGLEEMMIVMAVLIIYVVGRVGVFRGRNMQHLCLTQIMEWVDSRISKFTKTVIIKGRITFLETLSR